MGQACTTENGFPQGAYPLEIISINPEWELIIIFNNKYPAENSVGFTSGVHSYLNYISCITLFLCQL